MALISEIRKRSWLLIVMVGLGMGGFILMDMLGQLGVSGLMSPNTIGTVNGQKIDQRVFFNREAELFPGGSDNTFGNRESLWDLFVQEKLLEGTLSKLGVDVSTEEKAELLNPQSKNISPIVLQNFQYNLQNYSQFKQAADGGQIQDPQQLAAWETLQENVVLNRKETKLNDLVGKAIYTPTWMVDMDNTEKTTAMQIKFVGIPFAFIPDEEIKVTNSDISNYIKKNAYKYRKDEETRKAAYVSFDVIPTSEDTAIIRKKIADLIPGLDTTDEVKVYVTDNYGIYSDAYYKKDALSPLIADSVFQKPVGTVIGPYQEARKFKAVKIVDRKAIPDSVQVRHVLLAVRSAEFNVADMDRANDVADSLITEINNGISFDSIATANSNDPDSKDIGGDLGLNNTFRFGEDFDNYVMYEAKVGEMTKFESPAGVHIVEVTRQKSSGASGVKVAYLQDDIIPSEATIKAARKKAQEFVATNRTIDAMKKAAEEDADINVSSSNPLKLNDHNVLSLGSTDESRKLIKWMYKADVGEVSEAYYTFYDNELNYDSKFVVAGLESKQPKGLPSAKDMRAELETLVMNYKKGEKILSQIKAGDGLDAIATQFTSSVQEQSNINFTQSFIPGLGNEPDVIGQLYSLQAGTVAKPIIGNSGVFVAELVSKGEPTPVADYAPSQQTITNQMTSQITQGQALFNAMKKNAKIKDNRNRFY